MKRYTLLLILTFVALTMKAQTQMMNEQWFEQANAAYNVGNYDSAMMFYEQILATDMESVSLYYNMGNTYYKMREYPMAIYCYEKALKLDPSNDDVRNNLAIANLAIVDKMDTVPQSFIVRGWRNARASLSGDQWAWCSIVAFALLLVGIYLFLRSRRLGWRKLGFFGGIVCFVVFAFSVVFAFQLKQAAQTQDQAIIMTPTVTAKSSPSDASVDLFVLHEGSKVSILETSNGWNKIRIANGTIAWLKADDMLPF